MTRVEFMNELEYLLQDITDSEREEALQYYEDYFDDAGEDNEDAIIRELGSPERVAAIIKSGLMGNDEDAGEFTEHGYEDWRFKQDYQVPERTYGHKNNDAYSYGNSDRPVMNPRPRRTGNNNLGKIRCDLYGGHTYCHLGGGRYFWCYRRHFGRTCGNRCCNYWSHIGRSIGWTCRICGRYHKDVFVTCKWVFLMCVGPVDDRPWISGAGFCRICGHKIDPTVCSLGCQTVPQDFS